MAETDSKLIERTLAGEKGAFAEIVRRHLGGLISTGYGLTGDRSEAEELGLETVVRAYRGLRGLSDPSRVVAWMNEILVATQREWTKKKTRSFETVVDPSARSGAVDPELEREVFPKVAKTIAGIDETHRTVLALRYLQGYSPEEIGAITGETASGVNVKITRAHKALRDGLAAAVDLSRFAGRGERPAP